ncbi:hypothetical protein DH2020_015832 [Rehmannia glutinosa]|uniref:Uncharacterized protein n=1 Tax=Rehmannia glutinosa TaxID=99300 RepID=A0ABR0WXY1_REHGL
MEVNSVEQFCKFLVSCAFQRCRVLDDLCRLSVSLKPAPPVVRISGIYGSTYALDYISDTGTGSALEEFLVLKYQNGPVLAGKWDGVLDIATTSISDNEIHHLKCDLKEVSSRRLARLPSATKNGAKFRHSIPSSFASLKVGYLIYMFHYLLHSLLCYALSPLIVLKLLNNAFQNTVNKIAVELSVESGGSVNSQSETSPLGTSLFELCFSQRHDPFIKGFTSGLSSYLIGFIISILSWGKFQRESQKVCSGYLYYLINSNGSFTLIHVGIIMINMLILLSRTGHLSMSTLKSSVLYFRDFSPCSISQSSLDALTSIGWKNYGLVLKSVGDQDGVTLLEWENLPPCCHIDIVLHRYHKQYPQFHFFGKTICIIFFNSNQIDRLLTRKAVKLALTELKKRNAGFLLSERAVKICRYAPDLAKTISGLITSSHDLKFQRECLSLLGLEPQENEKNVIENCIKHKIISVIATKDRNSWGTKEATALFVDDAHQESYGPDEDYEEGGRYGRFPRGILSVASLIPSIKTGTHLLYHSKPNIAAVIASLPPNISVFGVNGVRMNSSPLFSL